MAFNHRFFQSQSSYLARNPTRSAPTVSLGSKQGSFCKSVASVERDLLCRAQTDAVQEGSLSSPVVSQFAKQDAGVDSITKRLVLFVLPGLSIPLADPLQSLLDTLCIGQFSNTIDLAALGPANALFFFSTYMFYCLSVATKSQLAKLIRRGEMEEASKELGTLMWLALGVGAITTLGLKVYGTQMMSAMVASPEVLAQASVYLNVRLLAQLPVLLGMVAQAALLAQRDSLTPCLVISVQTVCNFFLDVFFIKHMGWGIHGAAWATVVGQLVGCGLVLLGLFTRGQIVPNLLQQGKVRFQRLLRILVPLFITSGSRNLTYLILMSYASSLPPVQLAAHQAVYSVYTMLTFFTVPVETAAVVFVPAARDALTKLATIRAVIGLGGCVGVAGSVLGAAAAALLPWALSQDPTTWPYMASLAAPLFVALLLIGLDNAFNGLLLAYQEFSYVARSQALVLVVVSMSVMFLRSAGYGLGGVWAAFVIFLSSR